MHPKNDRFLCRRLRLLLLIVILLLASCIGIFITVEHSPATDYSASQTRTTSWWNTEPNTNTANEIPNVKSTHSPHTTRSSALSWSQTSDTDFSADTLNNTQVVGTGTGTAADVTLSENLCVNVSGGAKHSLALLSDGPIKSWGYDSQGQLGDKYR